MAVICLDKARKPTWLYACGVRSLPSLVWGEAKGKLYVSGPHRHRRQAPGAPRRPAGTTGDLKKSERHLTPEPFRDLLLSIAAGARPAADNRHSVNREGAEK